MTKLERQIAEFANRHYSRDLPARVKKAGEEYSELAEAAMRGDVAEILKECADIGIVIADIVAMVKRDGSLSDAMRLKFASNVARMKKREQAGLSTRNVSKLDAGLETSQTRRKKRT